MLSPRWRKVLQDLWSNKTRTLLVILSIAVGVFALGSIAGSRVILLRDMRANYSRISPQSAIIATDPFDEELLDSVRRMKGVRDADGRSTVRVQVEVSPGVWKDMQISALRDYRDIRVNKIFPISGAWPPARKEVLIERASLPVLGASLGDVLHIRTPDRKEHDLRISGTVHEMNLFPVVFSGTPYAYIDMDTLESLGQPRSLTALSFAVSEQELDEDHIRQVADQVRDRIKASGRQIRFVWIPPAGKYVADPIIATLLLLLEAMGLFSLLLSSFLIVNTVSSVLTEQVRQIGIMKAIGARRGQLIGMYLSLVCVYGLLSLAVAVPLGALGARGFVGFMARIINIDVSSWAVPPSVLALEVGVGLLVPLLTALLPVFAGTRVSVREAISDYGVGKGAARQGLIDRLVYRVQGLSRPLLLSLRNTFRRKGRLLRTLLTLVLAGAAFIGVMSVRGSVQLTLEDALKYFSYDVAVGFDRIYRTEDLQQAALQVPGVTEAESWRVQGAALKHPDGSISKDYQIFAVQPASDFVRPTVVEGRWLLPDDENAVVVNTTLLKDEAGLELGQDVTLKIGGRESTWRVVGIVRGALDIQAFYANFPYYGRAINQVSRAGRVQVRTEGHDAAYQQQVARDLKAHFEARGMKVSGTETTGDIRKRVNSQFDILIVLLLLLSVLMALVGGLGLMGTMSINVLERTREIGVMRAIGAGNGAILQVIMAEGVLLGLVSWGLGALVAVPMSRVLSAAIGIAFLKAPLVYSFSWSGAMLWLILILVIAALASILPAWRASRLSVREVLAYE